MMESCFAGQPDRVGPVEVDDIRRDLLSDFSNLPTQESAPSQAENLQVYLRVRPFTAAECSKGQYSQDCVTLDGLDTVVLKPPRTGDKPPPTNRSKVFGPESSQKNVFEGSIRGLVRDVLNGGNCLVFTYGVTNAGKTFTFLGPDHDSGLLPRSLAVIFNSIEGRQYIGGDVKPHRCRDFIRLSPEQQATERSSKKNLLRQLKESDRSVSSSRSTFLDGSLGSDSSLNSVSEDSFCLDVGSNVRFSIWVSFCEIYNDNIHDLLEQVPSGHHKRTVLRLSQDVKGNSFIKGLRWVQVNSWEEAYSVMKIGKKNQSFSSTRLNQLSSRSHSIFSIRILQVEDVAVPRILSISELALCDLAGSERCSRTQNTGERLKEAGNINSSLLTLGKCISAMRLNQNAKFQHHVPFRESKLTHFLQFFFCGAGRVSMVVNINQNPSCFDETLNVLKFSALAQKVVVLNTRPVVQDDASMKSAMELSMIIDEADQRRNVSGRGRSSLVAWETSLEDVVEDDSEELEEEEEDEEEEEESVMEGTVLEAGGEDEEEDITMEEEQKVSEAELRLALEAQIREEVSAEFMDLFNKMEKDYSERLEKERQILEERAEKRVEILKNLVNKTVTVDRSTDSNKQEEEAALLEGIISSVTKDLEKIKEDAQCVQDCLSEQTLTAELETLRLEKQQSQDQLQEAKELLEQQRQKLSELTGVIQLKDDAIKTLQAAVDSSVQNTTTDKAERTSHCLRRTEGEEVERRGKRQRDDEEEQSGRPSKKRVVLEEEIWRLHEENDKKEETIIQLREREERRMRREEELTRQEVEVEKERMRLEGELRRREGELKKQGEELSRWEVELRRQGEELSRRERELRRQEEELRRQEGKMEKERTRLEDELRTQEEEKENERSSLEEELKRQGEELRRREGEVEKERTRLEEELRRWEEEKENKRSSLEKEMKRQEAEVEEELRRREEELKRREEEMRRQEEELKRREEEMRRQEEELRRLEEEVEEDLKEQKLTGPGLCWEPCSLMENRAQQQTQEREGRSTSSGLRGVLEQLRLRSQAAVERSAQKCEQLEQLLTKNQQLEEAVTNSEKSCDRLKEELANQKAEFPRQLQSLRAELESEGRAREKLESERRELHEFLSEKENLLEESVTQMKILRQELERLKEKLQNREEEEEEEKENLQTMEEEERKLSMVEELKQEIQSLQGRSREFEAVKRQMDKFQRLKEEREVPKSGRGLHSEQDIPLSPLRSNIADKKRTDRRKRKNCEEKNDATLQKMGELIHSSPSILSSTAKTIMGLVSGHPVEKETVTGATKPRRGRRKLYKTGITSPLIDSPQQVAAQEEKESDHLIIKRQLRSCRK